MRRTILGTTLLLLLATWGWTTERDAVGGATPPTPARAPRLAAAAPRTAAPEAPVPTWAEGQIMVATADAPALAARFGARVLRPAGPAGYATLTTPPGLTDAEFRQALLLDPAVDDAALVGLLRGAKKSSTVAMTSTTTVPTRAQPLQWHLDFADAPYANDPATGVIVAVIDSGVAYATAWEGTTRFVQASSLSGVPIVSPWDFVEGDATPYDEHQHGTHIASTIASSGAVEGVSTGVSLMPLRVLDADNVGTEVALLDALSWARTHGAKVINLSLCFAPDYAPSAALVRALSLASEAGITLVAAAGNDGVDRVSYPAAHPSVIAVGAVSPASLTSGQAAWYSNYGPRLDIMAPGGDTGPDLTADGYVDGILAETIYPEQPGRTGLWFYVGTSQAAAVTTGAVAHLLAAGATPEGARRALQLGAKAESWVGTPYVDGFGPGRLQTRASRTRVQNKDVGPEKRYHASVMAWLVDAGDGLVAPRARVTITNENGGRVQDAAALVSFIGPADSFESCQPDAATGVCTVDGPAVTPDAAGDVWVISVDGVVYKNVAYRPRAIFQTSPGMEALVGAMRADDWMADSLPAFVWSAGHDDTLGDVVGSVMIADMAADAYASPRVTVLSESLLADAEVMDEGSLEFDGSGLITTPMFTSGGGGLWTYSTLSFGTGLITTPMVKLTTFSATSLEGSPLGLSAFTVYEGTGLITTPMASPVLLGVSSTNVLAASASAGVLLEGTSVGDALEDGGWLVDDTVPSAIFLSYGVGGIETYGESLGVSPTSL